MTDKEECYQCGGKIEEEIHGDFRDWVCQDCGVVQGGELVAEYEDPEDPEGVVCDVAKGDSVDGEVMET